MENLDKTLRIYYDAEFTGLHRNTTLISIGLVCENGHSFYAEFTDYDKDQVDDWIQENVINNLIITHMDVIKLLNERINNPNKVFVKGDMRTVQHALLKWLESEYKEYGRQIQIYSDCYAYDWMLFNTLICGNGNALNIPPFINYIPIDLSTSLLVNGFEPDVSREAFIGYATVKNIMKLPPFNTMRNCKHNSLWDAYVIAKCFDAIDLKC